jgi:DNA-binding SARP family transcriptional activator/Tol biopolymer transport system component
MIEFRTLGTLDLRRTDGPELDSLLAQPKRIALLAYLCLATPRGFHRRDTILGLFWPDSDESHARSSLRRALHVMRLTLGEGALQSRGDEEIAPNFDVIWCDAVAFDERLAAGKVIDALELYRGELLPGFFLDEVPMFERWLDDERNRLRASAARAARVVAENQEAERNVTEAVRWARRAAELTDNDERAVRRLIEVLARAGDRAGALKVYDDFAGRLASELDAEPSAETRALADQLRSARSPAQPTTSKPSEQSIADATPEGQISNGYRIEREIGRGGTAVVFLAGDLKHERTVALKVLRPEIAAMLGTQRFFAEISITARLNHPNIVTLLDSGEINGAPFYTMPYVGGETLRARLRREGALRIADALRIARDVADALSYAHANGVVHRDVKPENILLDNDRTLVTDFGIARAISEATSQRLTQPGLAMGTAPYMSPEQAGGEREVDARTDVYSLGCVLYEMLTGDPPFTGSSKQAILARKLAEPVPPLRNVRESVSPSLEQTVLKALSRTPGDRFRSVKEFSDSLQSSLSEPRAVGDRSVTDIARVQNGAAIASAAAGSRWSWLRPRRTVSAAATVLAAVISVVLLQNIARPATLPPAERKKLTFTGIATQGTLSPDGQFLAYIVEERDSSRLIVQDLTGGPADTILVFAPWAGDNTIDWSPNGARLLVRQPGKVLLMHRRGGQQEIVRSFRPGDAARWHPDGARVSLSNLNAGRFLLVNPENGDSSLIPIRAVHSASYDGAWSPDGLVFAVVTDSPDSARWSIRGVMLDGRIEPLVRDSVQLDSPRWSANGDALYYLRGVDAIWRVTVSTRTGRTTSRPEQVQTGMDALPGIVGITHFSLSRDGRQLVYAKGERYSNLYRVDVVDSASAPRMEPLTTGTARRWSPVVSPDGKWIAFGAETKDGSELFRLPIAGGRATKITEGAKASPESEIAWSPDGSSIAFQTERAGNSQIAVAAVSSGEIRHFDHTATSTRMGYLTWAPGSRITYATPRTYIRALDPATGHDELLVRDTAGAFFHYPRYSPNGRQIAMARSHPSEKVMLSIIRIADGAETRLPTGLLFPRAWSDDGRFIIVQEPFRPRVLRIDARGKIAPDTIFAAPARDMACIPVPASHEQSFICAIFDFFSDIWTIKNFDRRSD